MTKKQKRREICDFLMHNLEVLFYNATDFSLDEENIKDRIREISNALWHVGRDELDRAMEYDNKLLNMGSAKQNPNHAYSITQIKKDVKDELCKDCIEGCKLPVQICLKNRVLVIKEYYEFKIFKDYFEMLKYCEDNKIKWSETTSFN